MFKIEEKNNNTVSPGEHANSSNELSLFNYACVFTVKTVFLPNISSRHKVQNTRMALTGSEFLKLISATKKNNDAIWARRLKVRQFGHSAYAHLR